MKKIFLIIVILLFPLNIYATSGRLRQNSIISCNGQTYGQHGDGHWHIAVSNGEYWYSSGGAILTNPCESVNEQQNEYENTNNYNGFYEIDTKSSDTSLKSLKINNNSVSISEKMNYITDLDNINIDVETTDPKSSVDISNNYKKLNNGNNEIIITITAEDYTEKEYILNVYKESDNTNVIIKYNNEVIKFNDFVSETINTNEEKIKFDINLEDSKAKTNTKDNYKLTEGDNEIVIKVIAENKESKNYKIKVHKYTVLENIIYTFVGLLCIIIPILIIIIKKAKYGKCNLCDNKIKKDDIYCPYCGNKIHRKLLKK